MSKSFSLITAATLGHVAAWDNKSFSLITAATLGHVAAWDNDSQKRIVDHLGAVNNLGRLNVQGWSGSPEPVNVESHDGSINGPILLSAENPQPSLLQPSPESLLEEEHRQHKEKLGMLQQLMGG